LLYSSMSLALTFLGLMCLEQSALVRGVDMSFALEDMAASLG